MLHFNSKYFIWAVVLLAIEIAIALFVHDAIVRPYIGDLLVVILIYCLVRSFFNTPVPATAIGVLVFAVVIETLQYFNVVKFLGLQDSSLAKIIVGSAFSWMDIVCYIAGIAIVLVAEKYISNNRPGL
jgi:hypothetical protein